MVFSGNLRLLTVVHERSWSSAMVYDRSSLIAITSSKKIFTFVLLILNFRSTIDQYENKKHLKMHQTDHLQYVCGVFPKIFIFHRQSFFVLTRNYTKIVQNNSENPVIFNRDKEGNRRDQNLSAVKAIIRLRQFRLKWFLLYSKHPLNTPICVFLQYSSSKTFFSISYFL